MTLIRVDGAALTMGEKHLFDDVSFTINEGDKIGLVGHNGCGKSSLIRALMGEIELDNGRVQKKKDLKIGYVAQDTDQTIHEMTPHEYLLASIDEYDRDTDFWKADASLSTIGLDPNSWHQPIKNLSGGWRRLIAIAAADLKQPDLLILDEPTNHLDLGKIFHLENWLQTSCASSYIIISHDREFLDGVTGKTFILRSDGLHAYDTKYSNARETLLQEDITASKAAQKDAEEIKRLEKSAIRLREWGIGNASLAKRGVAIQHRADRIKGQQSEIYQEKARNLSLHYDQIRSDTIMTVKNQKIVTPLGTPLFSIGDIRIAAGDRIAILGLNGTGKSVFLRTLIHEAQNLQMDPGYESAFKFSPQVRIGYLDQHLDAMPLDQNLSSFISDGYNLDRTTATRELVNAGFPANGLHKKIGDLSFGERARLAILALKLDKPNFYVLDEPTNHLDIQGQEALEEALDVDGQACLFISHDRRMIKSVPTRYFEIKNGKLQEVDGPESFFEDAKNDLNPQDNKNHQPMKTDITGKKKGPSLDK